MLPGQDLYYECPMCSSLLSNRSLTSGNTFGAEQFSDGKQIAPMLPEFPSISKCSKCNNIFWLNKENEVEVEELDGIEYANFLNIDEYSLAIHNKNYKSKGEEIFLRKRIWWEFNDRVRAGKDLFETDNDDVTWIENTHSLLGLLDSKKIDQRIMIAELNRNLGNFQKSKEILATITDPDYKEILGLFAKEIANENRNVFQLW